MKRHTIRVGTMEWSGRNVTEARAEQAATLERLFADYGTPRIFALPRGEGVVLLCQDHNGHWEHRFFRFAGDKPELQAGGSTCSQWSEREAEIRLRRHLAQLWYESPEADGSHVLYRDDEEGRRDHALWVRFQVEYAAARAEGLDDQTAHTRACERRTA